MDFTPYERGGRFAWWCDRQQEIFKKMLTGSLFYSDDHVGEEENGSGDVSY